MTDYERTLSCLTICPNGVFVYNKDKMIFDKYNSFFSQLKEPTKRPDSYAVLNNELLLLEHFQFDNSKISKKGSQQHKVKAKSEREFEKKLLKANDFVVLNENLEKRGEYYIDNFITQFSSHYKKIDSYKEEMQKELKKEFKIIHMGFLIEDSSPLGSMFVNKKNMMQCLDLLHSKEFLDTFEVSEKLDFALFSMTGNISNPYQAFISRNSIDQFRKNEIIAKEISNFLFESSFVDSGLTHIFKI